MAFADSVTIGPRGINSAGLGLTGSGVVIGQVEQGRPGSLEAGDDLAHRNTTIEPADVFIKNNPGNPAPNSSDVRPHSEEVAGVMISTDMTDGAGEFMNGIAPTGVATGASLYSSAYVTEDVDPGYDDAILTFQFIATIPGMRAVNHSWGKPEDGVVFPNNGESILTMAIDWSASQHNVLHVIAGNQGAVSNLPVPKDNYNGMTIGRSAKAPDGVYRQVSSNNNYDADAFGPRTSTSLIAPGDEIELASLNDAHAIKNGSSFATPHVTGTVALLQQNATTTNSHRHEVMKAVLMNSADKIKGIIGMERTVVKQGGSNWFGSNAHTDPTIPLDIEMGTGHLNANRALQQFNAGEQGPGGIASKGWDYFFQNDPFIPNTYSFILDAGDYVSATLVWDRDVLLNSPFPEYQPGDSFLDFGFANLDLFLVSGDGTVIATSTSTDSNVEHIFAEVPTAGIYDIEVWTDEPTDTFYGLAWWAGADDRPPSGDVNSDGSVDAADYVVWRKTDGSTEGYNEWRSNFGNVYGSGSAVSVPEPTSLPLFVIATALLGCYSARSQRPIALVCEP
ncbi:MAG: S8 family serine peptidase [Planctomycetes bacterium]|nr:S8 family serine peptidase [Planctomycetota bacterium]